MKEIWEGDWDKGFELKFDVFVWSDGRKYEGYWRQGKQHWEGNYYTAKGRWEEDINKISKR